MSNSLNSQTKNAFEFIQKLFFEISYLIKEVEGLLGQEEERFVICRPSGYGVTSRTSTGLEPMGVENWLPKSFTVCFCREDDTEFKKGQTITQFKDDLKVIIIDIEIVNRNIDEPVIVVGCLRNIKCKKTKQFNKFEHLMWEFTYNREKIFSNELKLSYEDSYFTFEGDLYREPLYSIKNSDDVFTKIIKPLLKIYRS